MSHVAKINMKIRDLDTLETACKSIGLELARGQKTYRWWGHSVGDYPIPAGYKASDLGKCEHAIRIPNNNTAYEIGVVPSKTEEGSYELMWDFFNGGKGIEAKVGHGAEKLIVAHQVETAHRNIPRDFRQVGEPEIEANGDLVITLNGNIMEADSSESEFN